MTSFLDRAIAYVSPKAALNRMRDRAMMAVAGGYVAGRVDKRSLSAWKVSNGSADADILPDLPTIRERCRDLARNSPIASGAIAGVVNSVIGTGLSVQSTVDAEFLGLSEDQASEIQKLIEREFRGWADSTDCDAARTCDFYMLQELVFRSTLESGDVFALLPMIRTGAAYQTKIQLFEGDRVSNPKGQKESARFCGGVELDSYGAPLRYHIRTSHPGEIGGAPVAQWQSYEAFGKRTGRRNVLHCYRKLRPGQTRGVPYLAPVVDSIKQIDRYTDAEIMAAVVGGMFSVFVKTEAGLSLADMTTGLAPASGTPELNLKPGAIIDLNPGESIEVANPGRPNVNFDPFIRAILGQVAVALEIPVEVLTKQFLSSYSASRAALLEAWKFFKTRRAWLVTVFCQPVFEAWFDEAVAIGRIPAPGYFSDPATRRAYLGTTWIGDDPGQLDPLKEVTAAKQRIELGISTHAEETAALTGGDWETKHYKLAREVKMRREAGLMEQPVATAPQPIQDDKDESDDEVSDDTVD